MTRAPEAVPAAPAAPPAIPGPGGAPPTGLTSAQAAERLRADGPNVLDGSGRRTRLAILLAQVSSPLVLILVAASLVSLAAGDAVNASIILAIVVMSAALGFVQEARSESAVAALQARLTRASSRRTTCTWTRRR
jgi:Mg2+-importing ATPase